MVQFNELTKEKQKKIAEYFGYDLEEIKREDPVLYTRKELEDYYLEIAEAQGLPENLRYYLDVDAMIEDDCFSGSLDKIDIDSEEFWMFLW